MKSGGDIWDQTRITICIAYEERVGGQLIGVRGVDREEVAFRED